MGDRWTTCSCLKWITAQNGIMCGTVSLKPFKNDGTPLGEKAGVNNFVTIQ